MTIARIINEKFEYEQLVSAMKKEQSIVIDTETDGLDCWGSSKLCGIGVYLPTQDIAAYLPFRQKIFSESQTLFQATMADEEKKYNLPPSYLKKFLKEIRRVPLLIGHNIKFDLAILRQDNFELAPDQRIEDTMSIARLYITTKGESLSLENLCKKILSDSDWKGDIKSYMKERKIKTYDLIPKEIVGDYCMNDCINTYQIYKFLRKHAEETDQWGLVESENKLLRVVWDIEEKGFNLDKSYIKDTIDYLTEVKQDLEHRITLEAGEIFDPWSNQQISAIFNKLNIKSPLKTPKGAESWKDEALKLIEHKLGKLILNWREIDKLLNTFFVPYQNIAGDKVHPSLSPWGAITGRFTCYNPNIQQVPRNAEWDIEGQPDFDIQVRKMFIPPKGYYLYCMDFAQMEMLVFSDYLNDKELRERLNAGGIDFHSLVAKMIWKVDESHPRWKYYRIAAKSISLGLVYGMGINKLAGKIDCSVEQAQEYKNEYFKAFPNAPVFMSKVKRLIETRGYVFNRFGRRYYVPVDRSYAGVNYLVQGTSADLIKSAMIRIYDRLNSPDIKSRLCMQMHDEFDFYIHEDELYLVPELHAIMEDTILATKLPVDISRTKTNWSEKVNICKKCYGEKKDPHECKTE